MADRQSNESSSKSFHARPSTQGISLANLSEPLNFGPALIPTLQPVGTPATPPCSSELAAGSSSSVAPFSLDPDAEVDSFLGQHPSPQQTTPATSTFQSFKTPQQTTPLATSTSQSFKTPQQTAAFNIQSHQSTPLSTSSFLSQSAAQQQAQSGPRHFTMGGSGQDMDNFLMPQTQSTPGFSGGTGAQTPLKPSAAQEAQDPPPPQTSVLSGFSQTAASTSFPQTTQTPPIGPSHTQYGQVYPKVNPQLSYSQPSLSQAGNSQPPPTVGYPSVPLYSQGPPTVNTAQAPSVYPQDTQPLTYPSTAPPPMYPQAPLYTQNPPQPLTPQGTQQYLPTVPPPLHQTGPPTGGVPLFHGTEPVRAHWFYMKENRIWMPFSYIDSDCLEHALGIPGTNGNRIVPTDGGRYDVNLDKHLRQAIYWEESVSVVRRCTWFYKGEGGVKLIPYMEDLAARLEAEFQSAIHENLWPRKVQLNEGEYIVMHNHNVMVHFKSSTEPVDWSGEDSAARPKVVRRGFSDIEEDIEDGEPAQIDHLVFVIHGIGPIADLRFRNIIECIDDLRMVTLSMLNEHHEELSHGQSIGRIEYLPVQWHSKLHNDSTGVDQRLHSISLKSITGLREFTNSTLLDILFYTSPTYCQTIVDTVGSEMKMMLELFRKRNPSFKGQISVCGHSLGSSILFDILYHQQDPQAKEAARCPPKLESKTPGPNMSASEDDAPLDESDEDDTAPLLPEVLEQLGLQDYTALFESEKIDMDTLTLSVLRREQFLRAKLEGNCELRGSDNVQGQNKYQSLCSEADVKEMGLPMGPRKKLLGYLKQHATLQEKRKQEKANRAGAKAQVEAKTTSAHSSHDSRDSLMHSTSSMHSLTAVESVEVLYHQGLAGTGQPYVKYPKLDFKPFALFALGSPIGMFMTVRGVDQVGPDYQLPTCPRFLNIFHPFDPVAYRVEPLIDSSVTTNPVMIPHHKGRKRMHLELRDNLSRFGANLKASLIESVRNTLESIHEFARAHAYSGVMSDQSEPPLTPTSSASDTEDVQIQGDLSIKIGRLNGGNRIDYVLQEKPIESLNEYLFALGSHVCYWLSEDTALFMLREIYKDGI